MALSIKSLVSTNDTYNPPITLLYGIDGVGKTSLAAEFPGPALYLPTEGERPPNDVGLTTPGTIESFGSLLDIFGELLTEEHDFQTVIIDSLDGLEGLVWAATCARMGVPNLQDIPYNKGPGYALDDWAEYTRAIDALAKAGIYVVQLAHPKIVRFESPITDPYNRYTIKLDDKAGSKLREKADIVAFMNFRVSLKEKDVGFNKKVAHAEGGRERLIHLAYGAGFDAKSREGMPDSIPYKKGSGFAELAKYLPGAANDNGKKAEAA